MGCLQSAGMGGGAPKGLPVGNFKLMPSHQPSSLEQFRGKPVVVHLYTGHTALPPTRQTQTVVEVDCAS